MNEYILDDEGNPQDMLELKKMIDCLIKDIVNQPQVHTRPVGEPEQLKRKPEEMIPTSEPGTIDRAGSEKIK